MTLKKVLAFGAATLTVASVPTTASAATFLFELEGPNRNAVFTLEGDPISPDRVNRDDIAGDQIFFDNVFGTFGGTEQTARSISFGTGVIAPFAINGTSLGFTQFSGPDLFTGNPAAPNFSIGTFSLGGFVTGPATLTISRVDAVGAVPEPMTWALMLLGFAGVGFAMRRRSKTQRVRVQYT